MQFFVLRQVHRLLQFARMQNAVGVVLVFIFLFCMPLGYAVAGAVKVNKISGTVLKDNNAMLYEYKTRTLVCFLPPGKVSKVPGEFVKVKVKKKKAKKASKKLVFRTIKSKQAAEVAKLKKRGRKSASQLKSARKRQQLELQNLTRLCNTNLDFTLRWFPSDDAQGYYLYLEDFSGGVMDRQEVVPANCTHRLIEGVTSGVCELNISSPPAGRGHFVRLSAYASGTESLLTRVQLP